MALPPRTNLVEIEFMRKLYNLGSFEWPIIATTVGPPYSQYSPDSIWGYPTVRCSTAYYNFTQEKQYSWYFRLSTLQDVVSTLLKFPGDAAIAISEI
jgi:hypothetical protein